MGKTVVYGCFEWDEDKAQANLKKHKLSFEEAVAIFDDPMLLERYDWDNSTLEESRFIGIGQIDGFVVVSSCYTDSNGRTRIINARRASSEEKKDYERWCKGFYP